MFFSDDIFIDTDERVDRSSPESDHVEPPPCVSPGHVLPRRVSPPQATDSSRRISSQREQTRPVSPRPGPSSAQDTPGQILASNIQASSPEDPELDEDILTLLGDAPKPEIALGKSIHKDVASRWNEILLKGLQKEVKEKLLEKYRVPSNCNLLIAPVLNPEAKAALPETLVKRDNSIMQKQKQLGVALSALAQAVDLLINQESSAQKILQPISDACRILCDNHYLETKTRRYFVVSSINTNLKETLSNTIRDGNLFGDNVTEKLKVAKTIQKSGETLKNTPKPFNNRFNKNNFTLNKSRPQKNNLNFKTLHRKTQSKRDAGPSRAPPQRASQSSLPRHPPSSPRRRSYRR